MQEKKKKKKADSFAPYVVINKTWNTFETYFSNLKSGEK
jgi:hypothetical protein